MKYIKYFLCFVFLFSSCINKPDVKDPNQMYPPYKLINIFSRKIQTKTGLTLCSYGINCRLPKNYEYKNGIGNFLASYSLSKRKADKISLDQARNLITFLTENLLKDINSNDEVKPNLDVYPFTSDLLNITIHFKDENQIDLGQGVAIVYFSEGKITYEGYNIREYRDQYPAIGKHYIIHEESYADALKLVKNQGEFFNYTSPS